MECWLIDLARTGSVLDDEEARRPRLAPDDIAQFAKMGNAAKSIARRRAYIALRCLLVRASGSEKFARIPFERTQTGKPFLPGSEFEFSLSHTDGHSLLAIASRKEGLVSIGVDIEGARELNLAQARRQMMVAAGQRLAAGSALPGEDTASALQAFVRIEASAKALGIGVMRMLTLLGVSGTARLKGVLPRFEQDLPAILAQISPLERGAAASRSTREMHKIGLESQSALHVEDIELTSDGGPVLYGAIAQLHSGAAAPQQLIVGRFPQYASKLEPFISGQSIGGCK